jgi:hypothetical protein
MKIQSIFGIIEIVLIAAEKLANFVGLSEPSAAPISSWLRRPESFFGSLTLLEVNQASVIQ